MKYTALLFGALCVTFAFCSQYQDPLLQAPLLIRLKNDTATLEQKNNFSRLDLLGTYETSKLFFELSGIYGKKPEFVIPTSKEPEFFSLSEYLSPGNDDKKAIVERLYNLGRHDNVLFISANIGIDPLDLNIKCFLPK